MDEQIDTVLNKDKKIMKSKPEKWKSKPPEEQIIYIYVQKFIGVQNAS